MLLRSKKNYQHLHSWFVHSGAMCNDNMEATPTEMIKVAEERLLKTTSSGSVYVDRLKVKDDCFEELFDIR